MTDNTEAPLLPLPERKEYPPLYADESREDQYAAARYVAGWNDCLDACKAVLADRAARVRPAEIADRIADIALRIKALAKQAKLPKYMYDTDGGCDALSRLVAIALGDSVAPTVQPPAPLANAQVRRLYDNSSGLHKDARSFAGFVRIVRLVESAHQIGDSVVPPVQPSGATLEPGTRSPVDLSFDEWYAAQRHQLTNEQVCRLIWRRGWGAAARQSGEAYEREEARADAAQRRAEEAGQWISVDERLPEIDYGMPSYGRRVNCLVTTSGGWVAEMTYESNGAAKTEHGRAPRWVWHGRISLWAVVAWQPLPGPYVSPGASAERSSDGGA